MGKNRNLIVLGAVLAILAGLYLLGRERRAHLDETGGFVDLVEGTLATDSVYGISVRLGGGEGLELAKKAGQWAVVSRHDAPANLNKIRTLLGNLESLVGEVRSEKAEVLDAYALDDSSAYHLEVRDEAGNAMVALLIGESSGSGCFVRRAGSDTVLLGDHNFLTDFGVWGDERKAPDVSSWIDLAAFTVERDQVLGVRVQGEKSLAMRKEPLATDPADSSATPAADAYEWRVGGDGGFLAVRSKAEALLNSLVSVRARDVVGRGIEESYGLGESATRLTVELEDATERTIVFGAPMPGDENQLYFAVEGQDLVWSLPSYVKNNLVKSADDLRE